MTFDVLGSGSKGNCYLFTDDDGQILILECGVKFSRVMEAIDYDTENVSGCLVTHAHQDHCKYVKDARKYGMKVYALPQTIAAFKDSPQFYNPITTMKEFSVGPYRVMPFDLLHNVPICGFLIKHPESGNILFVTDTTYIPYTFENLNHIIIEANYHQDKLDANLLYGKRFLRDRIVNDHMSFETTLLSIASNDISQVNNIVLVHLSETNSDKNMFINSIINQFGKTVSIAKAGLRIENFNRRPF